AWIRRHGVSASAIVFIGSVVGVSGIAPRSPGGRVPRPLRTLGFTFDRDNESVNRPVRVCRSFGLLDLAEISPLRFRCTVIGRAGLTPPPHWLSRRFIPKSPGPTRSYSAVRVRRTPANPRFTVGEGRQT